MVALTVGRDPACGWVVDDEYANRHHATIFDKPDGSIWIRNEGALNGLFVNGRKVYTEREVHAGDLIRIGRTNLRLPALSTSANEEEKHA